MTAQPPGAPPGRIESIDAMRGFVMLFLIAEGFGFHYIPKDSFFHPLAVQFSHHPWHGLRFWDLIQPWFMFIVGVAMPFALANRAAKGQSDAQQMRHVLKRSLTLLLLGAFLECMFINKLELGLWNVLAQLSVTYLLAYLFMKRSIRTQFIISFAILIVYDIAFRLFPWADAASPWVKNQNFGSTVDLFLMGKLSPGAWTAVNAVSTTAHTMWGVIAGLIMMRDSTQAEKIRKLAVIGVILLVAGAALDPVTPIIKRIATSSFVIFTGGWCFLTLTFFYWLVDVKHQGRKIFFMTLVGMNPLFIYMVNELLRSWLEKKVAIFTMPFLSGLGAFGEVLNVNIVVFLLWYTCWWLYKRRIFIKI